MARIVTVFGATGAQGGSVAYELLRNKEWKVRAITRSVTGEKARVLELNGAELVYADFERPETLASAVSGAEVVFGVTDYWQYIENHGNVEAGNIETRQGICLVDVLALSPTLKHFIWSTLPRATPESPGAVEVPHFNAKNRVDMYIKEYHPKLAAKTTYLGVGWYAENMAWYPFFSPQKYGAWGHYVFIQPCSPMTKIPMAGSVRKNVGVLVKAILDRPEVSLPGKVVQVAIGLMTYPELLATWSKATGKNATYVQCTREVFESLYPATGLELALQYVFLNNVASSAEVDTNIVEASALGVSQHMLVGVEETLRELSSSWN
ncbi:hypothetical protein LTR84_005709 [Exophiala bonariae]|uniref:NmrA-like domain-containing protein n=1 Tax=Exophiala bonariae TaxID=1690606 RepID=A0AAV9N346_9EURO|nr:hypothetical protein LTR84_005709 [Exophiala bonariae]